MTVHSRVLVVGCGDLGGYIVSLLQAKGFDVFALARSKKSMPLVQTMQGDVTKPDTLTRVADIFPEYVVYCISADQRTDQAYQAQYVEGLRNILNTQASNGRLKGVLFVSSTRIYGQQGEAWIQHDTPAEPADFAGERMLEAETLLKHLSVPTIALRLSGIYGPDRLRMINLAKSPEKWPTENRWTNRIHRDDAGQFIVHLLKKLEVGETLLSHYVVTDNLPARQLDVLAWMAKQLAVNIPIIKTDLSGSTGKRLSNQAMLATGYQFKYPNFKDGYATLL